MNLQLLGVWALLNCLFLNTKPLHKLVNDKKGQGGVIYVLVTLMVMILVGIIIVNALISSVKPDTTWKLEANNTWIATQTNIWLAFSLVVIGIIIMGAVAILTMMRGGAGRAF